ncbi:hypothetical protein ACIGDI_26240 [Streptomyces sp. NPDC085900]|uniref:hypothetical protein n=1 Tax=Streptomyces sp. NPDC085900 TaxID=3365737 RepID=UPI0037D225C2
MTALATDATAGAPATTGSRGLPAVMLRLHRPALVVWAVVTALTSALLLWAHGPGQDAAHADWLRYCAGRLGCVWSDGIADYDRARTLAETVMAVLPLPVSAWAGAALTGRELESGTARLAWTQGVSPTRWLAAKLTLPAALLTTGSALLVGLHHLVAAAPPFPYDWTRHSQNLPGDGALALTGPLLGLAFGALAGLVLRRSLPAAAAAVAATQAVLVATGILRDRYPTLHPWLLRTLESGLYLTVTAAAVGVAFLLLRRRTV